MCSITFPQLSLASHNIFDESNYATVRKMDKTSSSIFSPPDDTAEEKAAVSNAVQTINRVTGRNENFQIEIVHWKTDTYPAVGTDAQSLVNTQVGTYDLILLLFRSRFGTPTSRANSGTEEEYDRARLRYLRNPIDVRIITYFGNPTVRLHDVDPGQLAQIKNFRRRIESEGILYHVYEDTPQFERMVTAQLTEACRDFLSGTQPARPRPSQPPISEIMRWPDWVAKSRVARPQSANHHTEIDLSPFRQCPISFSGSLCSPSSYFRFGFKLTGISGRLFSEGSIQTQDGNFVFHIGKNKTDEAIFYTVYRNGSRIGKDRQVIDRSDPAAEITLRFTTSADEIVRFSINSREVYEAHIPRDMRDKLYLLMWADENECEIEFTNIELKILAARAGQ